MFEAALKEQLERIAAAPRNAIPRSRVAFLRDFVLRAPLQTKLAGATLLVAGAAAAVAVILHAGGGSGTALFAIGATAILLSIAVNVTLVRLALRPLRDLESTAEHIWNGDLSARVADSPIADRQVARVGGAFNLILESLGDALGRARRLASEVIRAGDRERELLGRELHDGAAQRTAALLYQLTALERDAADDKVRTQVNAIHAQLSIVLEELRFLAESAHPRVLDDLGLTAALRQLARKAMDGSAVQVQLDSDVTGDASRSEQALVAYRVAQEAVRNALQHADASNLMIRALPDGGDIVLEVRDDGRGFIPDAALSRAGGMGLFAMRERVRLAGGSLDITSMSGSGTTIRARIPALKPDGI